MIEQDDLTKISNKKASTSSDKTRVSAAPADSSTLFKGAATEYTQFSLQVNNTSSGFAEAHALAKQALAGGSSGSLLKKRFLLEDVLGQGGMGTVYKTKDLRKVEAEDPNPYIATKVLTQAFKDHPDAFVTLQQETSKSHTLAHPNIVTVHDFDRDGDTLFMTMELLEGQPLDKLLHTEKALSLAKHKVQKSETLVSGLTKAKALNIIRDLCAALAYAHQRHIIHADFKPGNIFVCDDGTTKVLDFGIARAASKEYQKHKFDAASLGALTPAYATIEMVNDEPLSFTDDVYALACVVYEIVAGHHPYQNKSALDAKLQQIKLKAVPGLNHQEWKALSHALALDKRNRTPTVSQFMSEFFPRKKSLALLAAVLLSVVAVAGASWFGFRQYQAKAELQQSISSHMEQAQTCFAESRFDCALEHALVVANLDADNKAATQLVKAAQLAQQKQDEQKRMMEALTAGENCLAAQDDACAQVKAREVLALDANNQRAQTLLSSAQDLGRSQDVADAVQQGETCLQTQDLSCAELFAKKASDINSAHPSVKNLLAKIQNVKAQATQQQQAHRQKISAALLSAEECLQAKKYECAVKDSSDVLQMDATNNRALEIKQAATLAQMQNHEADAKINLIISQARECLEKKKNYACAIAKAETALDLSPNNQEAKQIKARAQEVQRKIKESGFNIK